jgi:cellulose synthase/poly-beta-1,6-N-acetylglucosamine synthase-like glycosyltransferase
METLLTVIQLPFVILAAILSLYLVVLTVAAVTASNRAHPAFPDKRRFAFIIPAHNEEKVLEHTLRSIQSVNYPPDLYDVIVIADNCSDKTAEIALRNGAVVFERIDDKIKGKGAALNWIFTQIHDRLPRYDGLVFVDGDSIVSENFLEEMNTSLHEGQLVIQASDLVLDNSTSWRVQLALIALALVNHVRPLGKSRLGLTTTLKGNGMCFAGEVISQISWDERSLTEDLDMGLELARRGIIVQFNPRAAVHSIMPTTSAGALTQRMRWEGGKFHSMLTTTPGLLKAAWKQRNITLLDAALETVLPPLVLFLLIALLCAMLNGILTWGLGLNTEVLFWGWIGVIGCLLFHCFAGALVARIHPKHLIALLYVPWFMAWKVWVYLKMLGQRGPKEWIRTAR